MSQIIYRLKADDPDQSGRSFTYFGTKADDPGSKRTILFQLILCIKADDPKNIFLLKADDLREELKDESRRSWTKYLGIKADDLKVR